MLNKHRYFKFLFWTKNYRRFRKISQKQPRDVKKNPWEYYSWKQKSTTTKQTINNFYKFL